MPLFIPSRRFFTLFDETETTSASTAFVNSTTQITLPIGTYTYEGVLGGSTVSTTAGVIVQTTMATGFAISAKTLSYMGSSFFGSTLNGSSTRVDTNSEFFINTIIDGSATNRFVHSHVLGVIKLTSERTFGFKISQRTTTDAVNVAKLMIRSYLNFSKIA
jgi:hypothetical protein